MKDLFGELYDEFGVTYEFKPGHNGIFGKEAFTQVKIEEYVQKFIYKPVDKEATNLISEWGSIEQFRIITTGNGDSFEEIHGSDE